MGAALSHLTVTYGDERAVDDVTLDIADGERFAIMGPSGAGKSTLLRAIAGLEPLASGSISIDGRVISERPTHQRSVGLMFQDYALFPHLTVGQNVAYGPRMAGTPPADRTRIVDELLQMIDLEGYADRPVATLSGGERQRVALARTLAPQPSLVMLDEPLGSVDQLLKDDLIVQMRDILAAVRATSIYVTHDRTEAESFADRIAIMRSGVLVRVGTPAAVWDDPHTVFVARFMGHRSIVDGASIGGEAVPTLIHADAISIDRGGDIHGVVRSSSFREGGFRSDIGVAGGIVEVSTPHPIEVGTPVGLRVDPEGTRPLLVDEI